MTTFTVLIPGYATKTDTGWLASCTTTLIRDNGKTIVVDPGANRDQLLASLKKENLTPQAVDIVFLTHFHPDHMLLSALFENAIFLDGETIYEKDLETEYEAVIPGTSIKVIPTPGHAHEHASLIFKTDQGKVVVAADLFWWTDEQEQVVDAAEELINREDPFTKDRAVLVESRTKVLAIADWIIPGHGKIFKNPGKQE
jgi:glyoxylase-like metal-dependent hydrolase (beta-lactamase superfamily II)